MTSVKREFVRHFGPDVADKQAGGSTWPARSRKCGGRGHLLSRAQFTTWTCPRLLAAVPSSADPSNGGGRAEAQAAHIQPVKANGPDSLRNGVALSSTFHWMFDRGLISIDDDYSLLFKRNAIPGSVESLVNGDRRLRLPDQRIYHPHPRFLEYHRERVFRG